MNFAPILEEWQKSAAKELDFRFEFAHQQRAYEAAQVGFSNKGVIRMYAGTCSSCTIYILYMYKYYIYYIGICIYQYIYTYFASISSLELLFGGRFFCFSVLVLA